MNNGIIDNEQGKVLRASQEAAGVTEDEHMHRMMLAKYLQSMENEYTDRRGLRARQAALPDESKLFLPAVLEISSSRHHSRLFLTLSLQGGN